LFIIPELQVAGAEVTVNAVLMKIDMEKATPIKFDSPALKVPQIMTVALYRIATEVGLY
jgi:hypothetical protein